MRSTPQGERSARWSAFAFELGTLRLQRRGIHLGLEKQPAQLLARLLEQPGRVVGRDELIRLLWPDEQHGDFDQRLNKAMHKLRSVLGDDPTNPRFIQTLSRYGYRFIAEVEFVGGNSVCLGSTPLDNAPAVALGLASHKRPVVRPTASAGVLVLVLFLTLRFVGSPHNTVSSAHAREPEIKPFVITKEGAVDPGEEGFKLRVFGQYDSEAMRNPAKPGWNRLKVVSNDRVIYYHTLSAGEKTFALSHDWTLRCVCALEQGSASATISFGPGFRRFDIELLREGDKFYVALTKTISPALTWDQKIEFAGIGDIDHPHTYELRFDHSTQTAALWIDGRQVTSGYRGHNQFLDDLGLEFGAYNYAHANGVGVFRSVRFEAQ